MPLDQDDLFASTEGDAWFTRNRDALAAFDPGVDLPLRALDLYGVKPASVVEIGAANGYRVAELRARFGCRAVAVDVSEAALADGRQRYPEVEFARGPISNVPVDEEFQLVIVNFVFHWVSRGSLLRAVAEVDRLCCEGGHILIGDFLPGSDTKTRYHHVTDDSVWTYKRDYGGLLMASGRYRPVCLLTADHPAGNLSATVPDRERTGLWLLHKPAPSEGS